MIRPGKERFLQRTFHSYGATPNTFSSPTADEPDLQEFPWKVSHPIPIIKRKNLDWNEYKDPVCQLVKEKSDFESDLNSIKRRHISNKKDKAIMRAMKQGIYSYNVVDFIRKLEQNPDIYFNGRYDWYYTGGTMDIIRQPYFDYLFFATGENMEKIQFQTITTKNKLKKLVEVDLSGDGTIYEVIPSSIIASNFAVRHKFKNSIFNYQATLNESNLDKICEFKSELPLISSAFDPFNNTTFCDLNVIGEFRAWNIKTKKIFFNKNISPIYNCNSKLACKGKWGALKNFERDVFIHCEPKQVNLIDLRKKNYKINMNLFDFKYSVDSCEEISCITKSKIDPNLMYIGTYHKLFGVDLRFVKKSKIEMSSVIRWTHQLKSPPLMIRTDNNQQEEEIILLASPIVGDLKICVTSKNDQMQQISNYLPYKPYSIHNSFRDAQKNGYCIDPYSMIKRRVKLCNQGISLMCTDDKNFIYTQNSAGDIFQQYFGDEQNDDDDFSLLMNDWMMETKDETIVRQHATEIINMKTMLIPLMQKKLKDKDTETFEGVETVTKKTRKRPRWQRTVNELSLYKDALANDLLAIWGFETNTDVDQALNTLDKTQPTDKVSEWLNRRPSTEDSKINLNFSLPVTFEHNEEDVEMENLHKTFSQPVRKRAAKRKYVKGF